MTTKGFVASHAKDAKFERGLRSFFEYRDLGVKQATEGRVEAHIIGAAAGTEFQSHDIEMLEVVLQADFVADEVASVNG